MRTEHDVKYVRLHLMCDNGCGADFDEHGPDYVLEQQAGDAGWRSLKLPTGRHTGWSDFCSEACATNAVTKDLRWVWPDQEAQSKIA